MQFAQTGVQVRNVILKYYQATGSEWPEGRWSTAPCIFLSLARCFLHIATTFPYCPRLLLYFKGCTLQRLNLCVAKSRTHRLCALASALLGRHHQDVRGSGGP